MLQRDRNRMTGRLCQAALVAGALILVTGCSGGDGHPTDKPSTGMSATPSKDPQAAAKQAILKAYQALAHAEDRTYAQAKLDPEVHTYAGDKMLSDIKTTLFGYKQQGLVVKGKVKRSPKVTALDLDSDPMKAIVTDCVDTTDSDAYNSDTGKAVSYDGPRRHVETATAKRTTDSRWKFYSGTVDRKRTC